jgi:hypothetical protein
MAAGHHRPGREPLVAAPPIPALPPAMARVPAPPHGLRPFSLPFPSVSRVARARQTSTGHHGPVLMEKVGATARPLPACAFPSGVERAAVKMPCGWCLGFRATSSSPKLGRAVAYHRWWSSFHLPRVQPRPRRPLCGRGQFSPIHNVRDHLGFRRDSVKGSSISY